jgi:hypothetical protein
MIGIRDDGIEKIKEEDEWNVPNRQLSTLLHDWKRVLHDDYPSPRSMKTFHLLYTHTHTERLPTTTSIYTHSLSESYLGLFFSPLFLPTNNISPSIFPFTKTVWTVERLCRSSRRRRESNKDTTQGETCAIWSD